MTGKKTVKILTYDRNGKLTKVVNEDALGVAQSSKEFSYDANGKLAKVSRTDAGKTHEIKEFSYSGEKLSKIVKKDAADKIVETKEFVYSVNKLAQTLIKNEKNEIVKSVKIERDAHGDVSKFIKEGYSVGENRVVEHDIAGKTVKEFDSGDKPPR